MFCCDHLAMSSTKFYDARYPEDERDVEGLLGMLSRPYRATTRDSANSSPLLNRLGIFYIENTKFYSSFSNPDPDWIQIQSGQWIRIRIWIWIWIWKPHPGGQNDPRKVLDVVFRGLKASSVAWTSLWRPRVRQIVDFYIKKFQL